MRLAILRFGLNASPNLIASRPQCGTDFCQRQQVLIFVVDEKIEMRGVFLIVYIFIGQLGIILPYRWGV
ncbi:hypothetical protein AAKU61_000588 [Undibacterium sp. GrIS 1.2]|uniref:hypothetical protein n=1 Tax=Undibacterium sp. GrIS 1.2 TaxID=3143933 RepID=UPI00339391FC